MSGDDHASLGFSGLSSRIIGFAVSWAKGEWLASELVGLLARGAGPLTKGLEGSSE